MDSADPHRSGRPRHDPEDSSGSSRHHRRGRRGRQRNKRYRNRWLYGVLSCGGLVLIVLMVAIVALQVVYFAKDNEKPNEVQGIDPFLETGNDSGAVELPGIFQETNLTTPDGNTEGKTLLPPDPSRTLPGSNTSVPSLPSGERGHSGAPGSRGPQSSTEETSKNDANTNSESVGGNTNTPEVIIDIPAFRTTKAQESVTQKTTEPVTGVPKDHPNAPLGTLSIRNVLLWLIILLFGVGVILVFCTVLFVKGYCRKVCPQKGEKFVPCACLRTLPESGDMDSRVTDDSGQRVREEFQMQNIRRPRDQESRSHDRDSANGTVRSSGDSIETSFSAPPPYCVAMTLPSVPNTENLQGRVIQTVINPPPARVVLPSYEDVVAEGSALPS